MLLDHAVENQAHLHSRASVWQEEGRKEIRSGWTWFRMRSCYQLFIDFIPSGGGRSGFDLGSEKVLVIVIQSPGQFCAEKEGHHRLPPEISFPPPGLLLSGEANSIPFLSAFLVWQFT